MHHHTPKERLTILLALVATTVFLYEWGRFAQWSFKRLFGA